VNCVSASIASTKPDGMVWDPMGTTLQARNPDPFCQLTTGARMRATSVVGDTLMPNWNASVTPTSGGALTSSLLMGTSGSWSIAVIDQDNTGGGGNETICTVSPNLTAAELQAGKVTFTNVASCNQLNLSFACTPGLGP
jgi:hypothetical protein